MRTLNLGILAHVDAGKTTLTERLLLAAGVIDEAGRVDAGTTRTDSLALERQRGITIKAAVVSFVVDGVTINLVDTPGHPDFIGEVERVLGVLDGAMLVVSAVEGVQSQTLLLFRALRRLGVPTLVFVNKIDRVGADLQRTLDAIAARLDVAVVAMSSWSAVGTGHASVRASDLADAQFAEKTTEVLAANDDALLRRYVDASAVPPGELLRELVAQTRRGVIAPVYVGAALSGVGVDEVLRAIPELLTPASTDPEGPPAGTVFKIERGPAGEKVAFVRMFSGALATRDRVTLLGSDAATRTGTQTVTAIEVFDSGTTMRRPRAFAGEIAKVHGWTSLRIGDFFGQRGVNTMSRSFPPPMLETAVVPSRSADKRLVFEALAQLAEQDPLINLRQDDSRQELFLSLYGEVQREVVAQTLLADYGLEIEFRPTTPVCIERPDHAGGAVEFVRGGRSPSHPFLATVGLSIGPLPPGSGVQFELAVPARSIPIHVFDSVDIFRDLMRHTVRDALRQGLCGWEVTDCLVTMTDCGYQAPPRKWPGTTLSDYRLLTPLVVMAALQQSGTTILEPIADVRIEVPASDLGAILSLLRDLDARPGPPTTDGPIAVLTGTIRAAQIHHLQSRLPDLTRGEGVLETVPAGYRPVVGVPPIRPRTDRNPLDRAGYLRNVNHASDHRS